MFAQLDRLTKSDIFMGLYEDHVYTNGFPDIRSSWESLGIQTRQNRVILSEDAPQTDIRDAIMD